MFQIGACYQNGSGEEKDFGKAAERYRKAAMVGSWSALLNLAHLCETGFGLKKKYPLAAAAFRRKIAAAGYVEVKPRK